MTKPFQRGLIVGKFAPLHGGHQSVIGRAQELCAEIVIISYSKPELPGCGPEVRSRWLNALYPTATRLIVTDAFADVPPNDADDLTHRRFVGHLCQNVLKLRVDAVFTSEDYGDGFAGELTRFFRESDPTAKEVCHVMVDKSRTKVPISGTMIRTDVHQHRAWLDPVVYASFVERVCFLGGESTGKSTLAAELARRMGTMVVAEYGRELWEAKQGKLEFDDLLKIAREQVRREDMAARQANRFLFCDTSPLTTLLYSLEMFGRAEPELHDLAQRAYDHVFLCAPDFPLVQDGTRRDEAFRRKQHEWYERVLVSRQIPSSRLTGSINARMQTVIASLAGSSKAGNGSTTTAHI